MEYPQSHYSDTDWASMRNRAIPGINLKVRPAEYAQLAQIADATGQSVSSVAKNLLQAVLPYCEIREVVEPRKKVFINLPDLQQKEGSD